MEPAIDRVSSTSGASGTPMSTLLTAEKPERKKLSGAARKRYRWLVAQGSTIEKALELCSKPWKDILVENPPLERSAVKRARLEKQGPPKKASKLSTAGDHTRPRKEGYSQLGIKNSEPMSEDQMKLIHNHLNLAIAKQSADGEGPQFVGFSHKTGWILVTCVDQRSQDWLVDKIPKLKPWPYAQLSVIPETELSKPIPIHTFIPVSEAESVKEALTLLKAQNKGLNTELWRVLNEKVEPGGRGITFSVDDPSIEALKASNFEAAIGFKKVFFKITGGLPPNTELAPSTSGTQSVDLQNQNGKTTGQRREINKMVGRAGPPLAASNRSAPTAPRRMHGTHPEDIQKRGGTGRIGQNRPSSSVAVTQSAPTSKQYVPRTETHGFQGRGGTYAAQTREADRIFGQDRPSNPGTKTQPYLNTSRQHSMYDTQPKGFQSHSDRYTDQREAGRMVGRNQSSPPGSSSQRAPRQYPMSGTQAGGYNHGSTYTDHKRVTDSTQQYPVPGTQLEDFHSRGGTYTGRRTEADRIFGRNGASNSPTRDSPELDSRFTSQRNSQRQQYEYSMPGTQREDFRSHGDLYNDQREADRTVRRNGPSNPTSTQQYLMTNTQLEDFRHGRFTSQREDRMIDQDGPLTPAATQEQRFPRSGTQPKDFHRHGSSYTDQTRIVDCRDRQEFEYPMPGILPQVFQRHGDTYTSRRESGRFGDRVGPSIAGRERLMEARDRSERPIQAGGVSWPVRGRAGWGGGRGRGHPGRGWDID